MANACRRSYKNEGIGSEELRRQRGEESVRLRKQKRETQNAKRRNVGDEDDDTIVTTTTMTNHKDITPVLKKYHLLLYSSDEEHQMRALHKFRKLFRYENVICIINQIVGFGFIPQFVECIKNSTNLNLQYEAAWLLTNITSGTTEHIQSVVEANAAPEITRMLESPGKKLQKQGILMLSNIAGDPSMFQQCLLDAGVLDPLLKILQDSSCLRMIYYSFWALANLFQGNLPQNYFAKLYSTLPTLSTFLRHQNSDIVYETCRAFMCLTKWHKESIQAIFDVGICPMLIELLSYKETNVVVDALHIICNLVSGNIDHIQIVINHMVLPHLKNLLRSPICCIRKNACQAISNICAGNQIQIQAVIEENIFPELISMMNSAELNIRKQGLWAVSNAVYGGSCSQIVYIVNLNCIPPLCDLLNVDDVNITLFALDTLEKILNCGMKISQPNGSENNYATLVEEYIDYFENLLSHESVEIFGIVSRILEQFFNRVEEMDTNTFVQTNDQGSEQFDFYNQ